MLKARLNLWPSSCDVAICNALPSRMMPSQVMVFSAPANRSFAVFAANDHRHGQHVAQEILVDVAQDAAGILPGVGLGGVRGVALLPEKLRGAQEDSRSQLPPHDIGPLIEKQREIAVAIDPFRHVFADDRFTCRT